MAFVDLHPGSITQEQVLTLIRESEQRRKIVWTASRLLKKEGSHNQIALKAGSERSLYYRRIRAHLKALEEEGILEERGLQFNFGAARETGYELVG